MPQLVSQALYSFSPRDRMPEELCAWQAMRKGCCLILHVPTSEPGDQIAGRP